MTTGSSTIRPAAGSTVTRPSTAASGPGLQRLIETEWREKGNADLVALLRERPGILRDRSLLLTLAVREFQQRRNASEIEDLTGHCERFREFGASVERSIYRQLDVQRVVDDCFGTEPPNVTWPEVGGRFGSFHVLEQLGFGAAARVFLCLQSDVGNRQVVVKVSPQIGIEASVLGRLNHPNITPIHSTGFVEESGLSYLCMPFCGRSTLTDLVDLAFASGTPDVRHLRLAANRWESDSAERRKSWLWRLIPLTHPAYVDCVLDTAIEIASALELAHSQRILHGDLKPSNVLLSPTGRPLLLDFNLSQDFTTTLRRCGGTLQYMAPEYLQLIAENPVQDFDPKFNPAPDIFSFGALLFELLDGTKPLPMPSTEGDLRQIAKCFVELYRTQPPKLGGNNVIISNRLKLLVASCMAFDASQRPPSMSNIREHLTKERSLVATSARRIRANPWWSVALGTCGVIAIGTAVTIAALHPPRHLKAYASGLAAAQSGDYSGAISEFDTALKANPAFTEARYARGRAHLHGKNLDFAMRDFLLLARAGNAKGMAMLAYGFNLQNVKVAAIPWYEKAIDHGVNSVEIENNLGACYIVTQSHLTQAEQIRQAERHLRSALSSEPDSVTIQLNNVRLAATKATMDMSYNPSEAWKLAYRLLRERPHDQVVEMHVSQWFRALLRYAERNEQAAPLAIKFGIDNAAWRAFEASNQNSPAVSTPPVKRRAPFPSSLPAEESRYFLEPFLLDAQQLAGRT